MLSLHNFNLFECSANIYNHCVHIHALKLMLLVFYSVNLSNEPPSEHKNTAQIWRNEKATEMLPKCISRLSRVLNSGNSSTRAIRFGIPLTSIAIFIIGIICRLTIELPEVNSTDLFKYNISAIHNFSHRYEPN